MFAGDFAPTGWMFCEGQLLLISDYDTLFNLIGTTYGGDGQTTFALPDLRGRLPIHQGNGFVLGENGGVEEVTLTVAQIPAHTHAAAVQSGGGSTSSPAGALWASSDVNQYSSNNSNATMNAGTTTATGGSQPHNNLMPYLCVNAIISLFGVYPSQG
jgi:microcystin-dependent protein